MGQEVKSSQTPGRAGSGSTARDPEKRERTVTFGRFPEDTKSEDIIAFIKDKVKVVEANIEEVFAFGKKRATTGAAVFQIRDAMWTHMAKNAGNHKHKFEHTDIYANADTMKSQQDSKLGKTVCQVVRAIIGVEGGDCTVVKPSIDTNYRIGVI